VRHYNSKKEQSFEFINGALKSKKSTVKSFRGTSGVKVELRLSKEVYKNDLIDEQLLRKRIIDLAYNNPGLKFYFNKEIYHFKKGLFELAKRIDQKNAQLFGEDVYTYHTVTTKKKKAKGKIDISLSLVLNLNSEERESFISFANSTPTFDGGFHHDRVRRLFINTIKDKLARFAKKEKFTIVDNDILVGITFVLGITMPNPRFESQTKRKLVRDLHLEKALSKFMDKFTNKFIRKNKIYLDVILERARSRVRFQELKDASKKGRKQRKQRVEKLLDANERKDRKNCILFICEGDSAIGGLRSARDKLIQGGIALRGKPMNVTQATVGDVLSNQEFSDIMASIGLTIGEEPDLDRLRYHKIVFLADSDVDGGHINTLLANFFFTYWPQLFEWGMIQYAKAPLFEVITANGRIFLETPRQLEKLKMKEKIKQIHRNKGLGEMSPEAFKYVLDRKEYTKIEIHNMKHAQKTLDICFGKDTGLRKNLLMEGGEKVLKTGKSTKTKSTKKIKKKNPTRKKAKKKKAIK
ncbi:MAG: toprim domain-containing protein, partial [Halobacteriovoraceae bacterium]|nr:toprim domain-containing protein [Halobacteriovoraceae bacterium]